jgi:phosphoglycerol transferase MdoB-like AlkP superfamily enzyme
LKPNTIRFLVIASGIYLFLLFLFRSFIPETISPTVPILALPLVLLATVLVIDLSNRATLPTCAPALRVPRRLRAREVQFLTRQVQVAAKASPAYFESIVRNRLRDLLVEKVSLETGMAKESVKRSLADANLGSRLLKDLELYRLLYYTAPTGAKARLQLLKHVIDRIEGWTA